MLEWKNVCIDVPNKNKNIKEKYINLVENLSGYCKKGELMAIMGPSGCGKTTFLGSLAGRMQKGSKTTGEIKYDGKERDSREWLDMIGFVDQDDQIFEALTVYETLQYAARFRLKNTNEKEIKQKIEELVTKFKVSHVQKNRMEKLSGGERKRVMLAIELITDPEVLFLDEPTSGLDSSTALTIIKMLKELTLKGKTIIVTIHQPGQELFNTFDKLLLMTDAKAIYFGDVSTCEDFFTQKNMVKPSTTSFPDFLTDLATKETITDNTKLYHNETIQLIKENQSKKEVGQILIAKNEDFRNFSIDFYKAFLIFGRQLKLEYKQKYSFYKSIVIQCITILILNLYCGVAMPWSLRAGGLPFMSYLDDVKDIKYDKIIKIISFRSNLLLYLVSIIIIAFTKCTNSFSKNVPVIQREISAHTYSTATFFLGTYMTQVLLILYWPVLYALSAVAFFRCFNLLSILMLFVQIFVHVSTGLIFAAIFRNQVVLKIMTMVLITVWVLLGLQDIGLRYTINSEIKYLTTALTFLSWITIIIPFNAMNKLISQINVNSILKLTCEEAKKTKLPILFIYGLRQYFSYDALTCVYNFRLNMYSLTGFSVLSFFLFLLLALYVQASTFKPSIRMKLGN